ncbi:MAG: hypothetical protein ACT4OI_06920, partial [Methanobacteriota archaeon]
VTNFAGAGYVEHARLTSWPPGWSFWDAGSRVLSAPPGAIKIQPLGAGSATGSWQIDDLMVGQEMAREIALAKHRHAILAELVVVLKGINGVGYWTNLGGRVYQRFLAPSELSDGEFPALFVVEQGELSGIRNDEHGVKCEVHAAIYGWVREKSEDLKVTTAADDASKLRDDVFRALLGNVSLNKKLSAPLLFRGEAIETGLDGTHGGVRVDVTLPYHLFQAELGPLAG